MVVLTSTFMMNGSALFRVFFAYLNNSFSSLIGLSLLNIML